MIAGVVKTSLNEADDILKLARCAQYRAGCFARILGVSLRQLERCFQDQGAPSPHIWLEVMRMRHAVWGLADGEPVKAVSIGVGFRHASHFILCFKRAHRVTPFEFARRFRASLPSSVRARPLSVASGLPLYTCPCSCSELCTGWCWLRLRRPQLVA